MTDDWPGTPAAAVGSASDWPGAPVSQTPGPSSSEAIGRGAAQGLTAGFSDELRGLAEAGGAKPDQPMGLGHVLYGAYKYLRSNPEAVNAYDTAVERERKANEQAVTAHPYLSTMANVAGAVVPMVATAGEAAPTLLGRIGQAARSGAGYGATYGAGSGEGAEGKLTGAAVGAGSGLLMGAAGAPIAEGIGAGLSAVGSRAANAVRSAFDPEGEAARRIITAAQHDLAAQGAPLGQAELQAAQQAGIPRGLIDVGGETTRALARSAANTSPEARAALSTFVNDRFETQAPRAAVFVDNLVGGAGDVGSTREALQAAARAANHPAYQAAYRAGSDGLWSPELERLTSSPALVQAMKEAAQNGQTRAVADGFGGFNPGVNVTPDGRVLFNRGPTGVPTYPDLQFWDYAYRNLRDAGQAALQSGRRSEGSAIQSVAGSLRTELDNMVPEYQAARQGAARFFGADNALQAGQEFATSRMANADAQRAVGAMNPAERTLFMQGYASQLINRINESGDRRSIANVFGNTPADRQRAVIALGPQRANQLEAYVRAERILDAARGAVQGNSTTARQLAELGLAGGAYGIGTQGDITHPTPTGVLAAAMAYGAMRGNAAINQRLAQRVGEMLTSNDPGILRRGFQLLGRNHEFLNALRTFDTASLTAAGTRGAAKFIPSTPALQLPAPAYGKEDQQDIIGPVPQQKRGGAVGQNKGFAHGEKVLNQGFVPEAIGASPFAGEDKDKGMATGGAVKATKAKANYRGGSAKAQCSDCTMFRAPHGCTAVVGVISPRGLCDYFEAKKEAAEPKINRSYDVPYLAGSSNDDKTVYIDRRVPRRIAVKRANGKGYVSIDPAEFLAAHETAEHQAMRGGKPYAKAHAEDGTPAERALVEQHGIAWKSYEAVMDGLLSHIEHEKPTRPPPNLYLKPYPHSEELLLKHAAKR